MANPSSSSSHPITEEREEVMVFEKGHTFIKTHFLKPIATSSVAVAELPRQRLSVSSSPSELLKRLSSAKSLSGFWVAERRFVSWVGKMEALHEPTWRKAGIFEAIKASTYNITKNPSLLLSVSQKWCPETNSFVFPWGEATVTLEDVMVLLGFSVLGSPVSDSVHSSEMEDAVEKLEEAWEEKKAGHGMVREEPWTSRFFGRGDLEHEAFLVLWLSLYVFPAMRTRRSISKRVVPIAVRLARGERIALAPAVLAGVYKDLGQISGRCDGKLNLKSLLKLVQVWTWERFKDLRPKPRDIPKGEPRIAQWDSLQQRHKNVRLRFDDFEWRPYTKPLKNWNPLRFYIEEAKWVTVGKSLGDEFAPFARCVRVSQLVGDGFVESYYPNRVAMQFGLAQDLPGLVTRHGDFTEKEAWDDYNKSLDGLKLYMPSRLASGSVTARYRDWWVKETTETLNARNRFDDDAVSPKVLPLSQVVQNLEKSFTATRSSMRRLANKDKIGELVKSLVSSRWKMKGAQEHDEEEEEEEEEDNMTIAQIRSRRKYSDADKAGGDVSEPLGKRRRKFQVMDSDDDSGSCQKLASVKIEERNEEYDETASNIQQMTKQVCDDEVNETGDTPGKRSMIADEAKKANCWLLEEREKKRCNEKRREDILEKLKLRNLSIKEKELKLEARIMEVEKTLRKIRESNTRGNKIKIEASA
ncbi:protein MAINTENANCE OF MERISTEMS isoform X3 [Brassica rapa]|uniref:protein MAINTENANCE OF MERISTEMS isoform X2 n=1 Tax=Brassica campestris TaxID=3711 RepID=UPI00142D794F|nr:protein MAINTENANCE OF MERISTEMS isoform X2 [Brassica rapa]XP_033129845.1 protein MAINTENANCE OF MERISTEMS isoform X3 [Brassica rapa]